MVVEIKGYKIGPGANLYGADLAGANLHGHSDQERDRQAAATIADVLGG